MVMHLQLALCLLNSDVLHIVKETYCQNVHKCSYDCQFTYKKHIMGFQMRC